ncbi:MAG TPA: SH3 domain-containing protein [Anaerolineales bacterium]|nr:SH3 domain-containing protein [Anaerolineales bacterium]
MKSKFIFPILSVLLLSSCAPRSNQRIAVTATVFLVTSLPVTQSPLATSTPLPPPSQPTVAPIEGTTSTQLNVRTDPSTASNVLGIIPANTQVQILGKDPGGNWLQIVYPQGVDGKGWVTAQYVATATGLEVRVIGGDGTNPNDESVAIIQQQINVRSGPGTGFNSLGTLNAQDVVNLTGKDAGGAWLQIEYSSGPDGKGWVNAAFVQAKGVENVPIITGAGEILGTGTPTSSPPTPTSTVIPAWEDGDSQENPIASVIFEPFGTHTLIYSGDISTPSGDAQDWIQFTPYSQRVLASLDCLGNTALQVNWLESGKPSTLQLACGDTRKEFKVTAGAIYVIHLQAPQFAGGVQYFPYTITIEVGP